MADTPGSPPKEDPYLVRLTILMDRNGNVKLEGTINNIFLAYGALDLAKDALRKYHDEKAASRIVKPPLFGNGGRMD